MTDESAVGNPKIEMMKTRHGFDQQLNALEHDIVRLGGVVEEMLDQAMLALNTQDQDLAKEVINLDDLADSLDLYIETRCMRLLALQQPVSKDLRTIGSILKATTDLERIGDFSVDIARAGLRLADYSDFQPNPELSEMAELVKQMVRHTLRAFVERDMEAVERLCTSEDDEIDYRCNRLFTQLVEQVSPHPGSTAQSAYLILVAHYLERIADHCTNVAERIYYMETGRLKKTPKLQQAVLELPNENGAVVRENGPSSPALDG
jgi:phosphate transport system protein